MCGQNMSKQTTTGQHFYTKFWVIKGKTWNLRMLF